MPIAALLAVALLSAALMGLAIQRGATCMVAAVDEILSTGRATRAAALAEAALWVGGLAAIAAAMGWLTMAPAAYAVTGATIAGGVLLGIGAWVNQACVFGAVARIGSGQWAWLATPVGFFLGCLVPFAAPDHQPAIAFGVGGGAIVLVLVFAVFAIWRVIEAAHAPRLASHLWHPHRATLLIAVTFVATLLSAGNWAYTDALAALARSMDAMVSLRATMGAALFAGAVAGGAIAGKLRREWPRLGTVLRCATGGILMGMGGALVPGSNDGLILLGLPAMLPHAWVAVGVMTLSIAAAIKLEAVTRAALAPKT
jgi:toxin CptA